jgi:hypothetical protein
MNKYKHIVDIDEETGLLIINRFFEDGRVSLYTHIELSKLKENPKEIIYMIGENILLDSPVGRKFLPKLKD